MYCSPWWTERIEWICAHPHLRHLAATIMVLAHYTDGRDGIIRVTKRALCERMNVSESTAGANMRRLVQAGCIEYVKQSGGGGASEYRWCGCARTASAER